MKFKIQANNADKEQLKYILKRQEEIINEMKDNSNSQKDNKEKITRRIKKLEENIQRIDRWLSIICKKYSDFLEDTTDDIIDDDGEM